MCCNDELSWLFTNRFSATRYMKVKRMGITEILRRIWLFSAIKIKSSESVSKQPTQLIIAAEIRHISDQHIILNPSFMTSLMVCIFFLFFEKYVQADIFRYQCLKCLHNHQFHNCTYDVINYAIYHTIFPTQTHTY